MISLINSAALPSRGRAHSEALDGWRAAARLVAERWKQYTQAGSDEAAAAYGAYLAALDAEEAAAYELHELNLEQAA